jgi:hypothetical protein
MVIENKKNGLFFYIGGLLIATACLSVGGLLLELLHITLGI